MADSVSFNLIEEPFLPCLALNGARRDLGIRETLLQAHQLRSLRDESPVATVALHRLLLAILHRVFGPDSVEMWRSFWQAGQFDSEELTAYFDQWHERFDLFHKTWPFYQMADFAANQCSPVCRLVRDMARNTTPLYSTTRRTIIPSQCLPRSQPEI